jgi:hypothetical protein
MSFRHFLIIILALIALNLFADAEAKPLNVINTFRKLDENAIHQMAMRAPNLVIVLDQVGCGACEMAKDFIKKIDTPNIQYVFVDYSRVPAKYTTAHASPTFLFFKDGQYKGQYVGVPRTPQLLLKEINKGLGK